MRSPFGGPRPASAWGTESAGISETLNRGLRRTWAVIRTAILSFDRAAGTRQAAQLSFYVLLAFPALLLLAVWVLSNVFDTPEVRNDLIDELIDNLPLDEVAGRREISDLLDDLTRGAGRLGVATAAILLYSGSAAVGAIRHAVETANETEQDGPPFPKNKLLDILITAVTLPVVLLMVGLGISGTLNEAVADSGLLSFLAGPLGGPIGSAVVGLLFFAWLFWVLNPGETPAKSAFLGAGVTVVLGGLVTVGLRLWFGLTGGGSSVYGVLAGFLGTLLFLNLASIAIVLGAHFAATFRARPWRSRIRSSGGVG
ncbi:MAG: YihY/virulence factor BrkB family protein [Solirubrobacterales bacterium]|nr:YihY/virulence factor BrkB family protein [Solirubrobacterales bacterium]